jgi:hypothetical protein
MRPKPTADVDQQWVIGPDAGAMTVTVNLDQDLDWNGFGFGERMNGFRGFGGVEDDAQLASRTDQPGDFRQLHRCDSDCVEDVPHAMVEKIARLDERGDRDRHVRAASQHPQHVDRLRSLDVGAQGDAERAHFLAHPGSICVEPRAIEDQRGRHQVEDRLRGH